MRLGYVKSEKRYIIILIYLSLESYSFFLFLIFMNYCKSFWIFQEYKSTFLESYCELLVIFYNFLFSSIVRDKNALNKREMWRLRNRYATKGCRQ